MEHSKTKSNYIYDHDHHHNYNCNAQDFICNIVDHVESSGCSCFPIFKSSSSLRRKPRQSGKLIRKSSVFSLIKTKPTSQFESQLTVNSDIQNMSTEHIAVTRFREYLRIKSVHPTPDYKSIESFLSKYAQELGLGFSSHEYVKGKPICILTWNGSNPSLPSLLLNSHTDVVPVSPESWTVDPFAAVKRPNGDIVARGAQDMKCVGIGYLEAIRELKLNRGYIPIRTIHLSFVPDEETSGADGMQLFIKKPEFKALNVGFALDEGLANPNDAYSVFYGERAPMWIKITAHGGAGHGSRFIEPYATGKLLRILNNFLALRETEQRRLKTDRKPDGRPLTLGDVTSCNITILQAGFGEQYNVVAEKVHAGVDLRVAVTVDLATFKQQLKDWIASEPDCEFEFIEETLSHNVTYLNDQNPWWGVLKTVAEKRNIKLETDIFSAATDSRFLRGVGIPAIGISPIRNTPILLHDHDEYLNESIFLEGVEFYTELIAGLSAVTN